MAGLTSRANLTVALSVVTLLTSCTFYWYTIAIQWQMHHAATFNSLHEAYAAPEMMDALDTLHSFAGSHASVEEATTELARLHAEGGEEARRINHARRRLQHWYTKLCLMHEFGLIDAKFLAKFPGKERARRFIRIVEPIANTLRAATDRHPNEVFDAVRDLYGLGDEASFVPRPSAPSRGRAAPGETRRDEL